MPSNAIEQDQRLLHLPLLALSAAFILLGLGLSQLPFNRDWMLGLNHLTPGWDDLWSFATQFGDAAAALLLLLVVTRFSRSGTALALKVYVLGSLLSPALKSFFASPRPLAVFEPGVLNTIGQAPSGSNSMPSGHSMTVVAAVAVFMVCFSLKDKKPLAVLLIAFAAVVAVSRIMVGAHWPADVLAGAGLGLLVTWLALLWEQQQAWQPHLQKRGAQWALLLTEVLLAVYLFMAHTSTTAERLAFDLIATVGMAGIISRWSYIKQHTWA
jgi:membrane-associated phospholipid phosphatase